MQNARPPALEIERLEKHFTGVHAVRGISFSAQEGTIIGLLGGNGAGKTTTIGMLLGLVEPSAGSIRLLGVDAATDRNQIQHQGTSPCVAGKKVNQIAEIHIDGTAE